MPDWINVVLRSISFLIILFVITKIAGRKQISELSLFEYIAGITVGAVAAEVATGLERNLFHGMLIILVIGSAPILSNWLSIKSKKFRDFIGGTGTIFIKDGKIMEDNLKKEKYSTDDLLGLLRKKNVFQVADVEFAVLETTGDLSVLLKKENQPLTPKAMGLKVAPGKEPQTVIMDGKILDEPLATIGLNRGWLKCELEKLGVSIENVFLGQVDSYGQLTVDLFDDKINVPSPTEMPLLLSTLKKCQADLELFALQTESKEAKEMYTKNSKKLNRIVDKVTPFLDQ